MRIVVTGATGNVGTAVIDSLNRDETIDEIVGVARRLPDLDGVGSPLSDGERIRWVGLDVSTDASDVFDGADVVIHLASQIQPIRDERRLHTVNVEGTTRVVEEAARRGVGRVVVASSVGAYAAARGGGPVDESWPADGIPTSVYSRQKAEVERRLDQLQLDHPDTAIVRMRTSLVFSYRAAAEISRYFLGPLVPTSMIGRGLLPVVPIPRDVRLQVVHAPDAAEAYRLAALGDARGAFNIAPIPASDRTTSRERCGHAMCTWRRECSGPALRSPMRSTCNGRRPDGSISDWACPSWTRSGRAVSWDGNRRARRSRRSTN